MSFPRHRVLWPTVGFALAMCLAFGAQAASLARSPATTVIVHGRSSVSVSMGNTETLRSDTPFVDLVVGDPEIADAMPLTDRSFYVHGRKLGTTTISAYDASKALVAEIEVEVGYNTSRLRTEIRKRLPGSNVEVSTVNGHIMMSGSVTDAVALDKAMTIARQFGQDPINSLTISQSQQVMLEVRFIEVSRNLSRALGTQWNVSGALGNFTTGPALAATGSAPFASILGHVLSGGVTADALVQALEDKGLARRLAEPNLTTMSGQTASFLAGGEYPFPVAGQNGAVTVDFKKFGVGLGFTPVVLANRTISLRIEPEVSQIDASTTVQTPTGPVPSLIVRRASTQVELRDGQSFAIAGLMQNTSQANVNQLPWLGDVPIIGTLFRSNSFVRNETELAIIVTPHLVRAAPPGEKLHSPLESNISANDLDRYLNGQLELGKREADVADMRNVPPQGHFLGFRDGGGNGAR